MNREIEYVAEFIHPSIAVRAVGQAKEMFNRHAPTPVEVTVEDSPPNAVHLLISGEERAVVCFHRALCQASVAALELYHDETLALAEAIRQSLDISPLAVPHV